MTEDQQQDNSSPSVRWNDEQKVCEIRFINPQTGNEEILALPMDAAVRLSEAIMAEIYGE